MPVIDSADPTSPSTVVAALDDVTLRSAECCAGQGQTEDVGYYADSARLASLEYNEEFADVPKVCFTESERDILAANAASEVPPAARASSLGTESQKDRTFTGAQITALRQKFDILASEDGTVHSTKFHELLDSEMPVTMATKLFEQLSGDDSDTITFSQFTHGMRLICQQSWQEQASFVFGLFDLDGDGKIDKDELLIALTKAAKLGAVDMPKKTVDKLFASLCSALGINSSGSCTLAELFETLEKHPYLRPAFSFHPLHFIAPHAPEHSNKSTNSTDVDSKSTKFWHLTEDAIEHSIADVEVKGFRGFDTVAWIWIGGYIAGSIALAVTAAQDYAKLGYGMRVQIARAGGANLNFHAILLLGTMLRNSCSFLCHFPRISKLFPLSVTVPMHKGVAVMNVLWACVHTIGHGINYGQAYSYNTSIQYVFTDKKQQGWVDNVSAGATGFALCVLLFAIVAGYILAHGLQRKISWAFEIFYFSHFLTIVYFVVMFIHAPHSKWWLVGPFGLYILEWGYRLCRRNVLAPVLKARALNCGATCLELQRPATFRTWHAGAYAFINIPEIAFFEWHPITISSSARRPGNTIVFNIKGQGKGTWTGRLADAATAKGASLTIEVKDGSKVATASIQSKGSYVSASSNEGIPEAVKLTAYLDGPYGAPTQDVFLHKHSILVGAGIGVTPSGAILDSVLYRCKHSEAGEHQRAHNLNQLERLDFCWLNNDLDCTEWFTPLLASIEEEIEQHPDETLARLIHTHIFLTSLNSKSEKEAVAIHLAIDALTATDEISAGFDFESRGSIHPIIGLKEKVHPGRPNWELLLKHLMEQSPAPDDICIFFCGPPAVGEGIAAAARKLGKIKFQQEVF
jgi:Ca2+-binding EF-hand superfamily protein/predicted ferric reductase